MFDRYSVNPLGDGFWKLEKGGHKSMTLAGAGDEYRDPQCKTKLVQICGIEVAHEAGVGSPDTALA
jgi:hypothetical protein